MQIAHNHRQDEPQTDQTLELQNVAAVCAQASTIPFASTEPELLAEPQTRGCFVNLVRNLSPGWLELELGRIADSGFNLIMFPVYNNGWTLFPSDAVHAYRRYPRINPLFKKWNPLETVVVLAQRFGLGLWGFARPYNFHPRHSVAEHKLMKKFPEWRMRTHPAYLSPENRRTESRHPCPFNPEYRRFMADLLGEVSASYPLQGMVLDFTDYNLMSGTLARSPFCFCESCSHQYHEEHEGNLIDDAAGEKLAQVRQWQLDRSHHHLSYLRHRLLKMRRTLRLVGRVRPHWRDAFTDNGLTGGDHVLFDWPRLLEQGLLEEVIVDHAGEQIGPAFSQRAATDYAYLGDHSLFMPMVSISGIDDLGPALQLQQRIPVPGVITEFQTTITPEDSALIRERHFPQPAFISERNPIRTALFLINRVRRSIENQPAVGEMLNDFIRLLTRQYPHPDNFELLQILEENLLGLEQAIRRGRLGPSPLTEDQMSDLGLARRFVRLACMDVRT